MIEWVEGCREAAPNRRGARGRHLLPADDMREPRKARLALPQRRHAGRSKHRFQPRILLHQRLHGVFEVGLGFEVDQHPGSLLVRRHIEENAKSHAGS